MKKKCKIIFSVLFLFFICAGMISSSFADPARDPQDAVIQHVLRATGEDLGFGEDADYDVPDACTVPECRGTVWIYDASDDLGIIRLVISTYADQQSAADYSAFFRSQYAQANDPLYTPHTETFHGYSAWYVLAGWVYPMGVETEEYYYCWSAGRFFFQVDQEGSLADAKKSAEALYANAVAYGLMTGATTVPDTDGDGVADDADQCPGTGAGLTVDADGCPIAQTMNITINADKTAYAPGETALISGTVSDSNGALAGVAVSVDVSGTMLSATTDASGNYNVSFPIPADAGLVSFPTTATATHAGYPAATASTVLATEAALTVLLSTDKDHYLIGDTVYFTIEVKDSQGNPVGYAGLNIVSTRLGSGTTSGLTGSTDATGENVWSFTWGQDASGNTIAEGKLQVDVTASKEGYADGSASITLSGCGDLEKSDDEDCLDCPEDCMCDDNEVCDPSGSHKNPDTFCSPKMAYVFISKGLGWYHEWWASDDIKQIRKFYKSRGYTVSSNIYVDNIRKIATYLSRPSTKAIAYAGHGEEPGGVPTIESVAATPGGNYSIKMAIDYWSKEPGGFLYICQFETYAAKWVESKDKIKTIAQGQVNHPNLDYAFLFSCYSLDDTSMRDYLLKSGGTYWGYKGKLPGNGSLTKSIKP